jgi:hypothetical protein
VSRRDPATGEYEMEKAPCYHLIADEEPVAHGDSTADALPV